MTTTLKDVLELKGFKKSKLIAGHKGIENIVKKATLMEVPDIINFVNEYSLIITTLYPISTNVDMMKDLIPECSKLNVSGICIKIDRYVDKIPEFMINQANELNFPIIELNNKDNLSDLVYEIINMSLDGHIESLEFRNLIHNHLMDFFLRGEEMDVLIDEFAQLIKHPVILLDNSMKLLVSSKDISDRDIAVTAADRNFKHIDFIIKINEKRYTNKNYIKQAIKAGKNYFGYLVLICENINNQNMHVAVEQASLLIASAFYKNFAVLEKEKNFQDSFIRDILSGVKYSQMEIIMKAKTYGWDLEFPQVLLILKIFNDNEGYKKNAYESILSSGNIENILSENLLIKKKSIKITYIDESLVIFVNVAFINEIKQKMIDISNEIKEIFGINYYMGMGISNIISYANDFPAAYREVHDSIIIGKQFNKDSFVGHYDDFQLFSLIKEINDINIADKYVKNKIGKILIYDEESNMDLLNTLIVLAQNGFNSKKAAEKLFIHYNTMRHRMELIKKLGIDLGNGIEVSEIILAYNIHVWLKTKKT